MKTKYFFDTNILVYTVDEASPAKKAKAQEFLRAHTQSAYVSTQVLQEYYATVTRKLGIPPLMAKQLLHGLMRLQLVSIDSSVIFDAVDIQILNKVSFWDALIVAAAKSAGCNVILSEDMSGGQTIAGIRVQNPFI
jgi:predicted nucleic acid-binding protein